MRKKLRLTGITNGAAGDGNGVVSVSLSKHDISAIILERLTGTIGIGNITNIKLTAGSEVLWDISGAQFDEINKARGLAAYDGTTFYLPMGYNKQRDMAPAIGTALRVGPGGYADAMIEITFSGGGAMSVDVSIECSEDAGIEPPAGKPRLVRRLKKYEDQTVAGDENTTTKLRYGPNSTSRYWAGMYLYPASGNLSKVRIKAGDTEVLNVKKATMDLIIANGGGVVSGYYGMVVDFLADQFPEPFDTGLYGDVLVDVLITSDSAAKLTYVMDTHGPMK